MWFEGWESIWRTVVSAVAAYGALVVFLRLSGKRTLAKMNAFDFVITVALGSTLATIVLSKDVSIASGVTALAMLILLQYVVASLMVRSQSFQKIVKSQPVKLFRDGAYDESAMRRERVVHEEVLAAMRDSGYA
ncbi:MAG TPA: DUF421 domain-containing protein, partial [Thermoanaerobaculia bacterium]|nr:DUF421 domain-containing protein [Thermoanaerobaculia bacterium]